MLAGSRTHFVLSAGSGSGGGGYNRGRNDYRSGQDDRGSGGYSRGNDERGGGGYGRNRNDDNSSGGYNRGRSDHYGQSSSDNGHGGEDTRMETQYDTIFIQNLPKTVTVDELKDVFSQIGIIKVRNTFI